MVVTLVIRSRSPLDPGANEVEVVERKGRGHPDTICDALSEEVSRALCRYYLERFGRILHHNVDKVLLVGGSSKPCFGGGEIIRPIEIFVAGRATAEWFGSVIPVAELAEDACLSVDLSRIFGKTCLVTFTSRRSCDQGRAIYRRCSPAALSPYWPMTPRAELDSHRSLTSNAWCSSVENALNDPRTKAGYPAIGEDIKVMAVRHRRLRHA